MSAQGFFLTDIDPRAKTEGARDPLGIQTVWSGIARTVISNLTTQTISLTDFRILLTGCYLAAQVGDDGDPFVVWEQLCGHVRFRARRNESFRGVEKVRKSSGDRAIHVSPAPSDHLLAHQRTNGIWGAYVAAAQRSGLVDEASDGFTVLTADGRRLVESSYAWHLNAWGAGYGSLLKLLRSGARVTEADLANQERYESLTKLLVGKPNTTEKTILNARLIEGKSEPTVAPLQAALASQLSMPNAWNPRTPRASLTHITESTTDEPLQHRLRAILAAEQLLASSAAIFSHLTGHEGARLAEVAAGIAKEWAGKQVISRSQLGLLSMEESEGRLRAPARDGIGKDRWVRVAQVLHDRDYLAALELLCEQNTLISRERGGVVGWVELDQNEKVVVRRIDDSTRFPASDELTHLWMNSYFIPNLAGLAAALGYR